MSRVLLLRHAESRPDHDRPEAEWPLSERGHRQAQQLIAPLSALRPERLFASPYRRAQDTLGPFARDADLAVTVDDALRECMFRSGFVSDWPAPIARAWADRRFASPGCESAETCQTRIVRCVQRLARQHSGERLLCCSHGNAIALLLNALDPTFGFDAWRAMAMPALYEVDVAAREFSLVALPL